MVQEGETSSHVAAHATQHATSRLSLGGSIINSIRHSMDGIYNHSSSSNTPPEAPPSYEEFLDSPYLRRRFGSIQPREDEGREALPPYSSAISLENVFMRKMELEGAVHQAHDRNWYKVMVTLQGTALTFHRCKSGGLFGGVLDGKKHSPDFPSGVTRGAFLRSYNLQHADVGIAADYVKKRYVIRVRAETEQFLLSCHKIETFVLWLQSLFAAIDLAPPLDDREIPQDLSIPRRIRRRRVGPNSARDGNGRSEQLIREQEEIVRTQFPGLADESGIVEEPEIEEGDEGDEPRIDEEEREPSPSSSSSRTASPSPTRRPTAFSSPYQASILASSSASALHSSSNLPSSSLASSSFLTRTRRAFSTSSSSNINHLSPPNPSINPDGKWQPQHQWTHFYDMMYAKRCMAILTHRSPRKSNLVIMKGKQWIVDWATGKLTRVSPPEYAEVATGKGDSGVRLGEVGGA